MKKSKVKVIDYRLGGKLKDCKTCKLLLNLIKHPKGINRLQIILLFLASFSLLSIVLIGEIAQLPPVLFTFGGLAIALGFHYLSVGNTVYSISVPLGNRELFKKADSISLGGGQITVSGAILILNGLFSFLGIDFNPVIIFKLVLFIINVISLLLFWKGLIYALQFIPWITVNEIPPKRNSQCLCSLSNRD